MPTWFTPLMQWLALPEVGLSTVFVVAFVSATLLPMGSEPAVFGLVKLNPDLFWAAVGVATVGNTLGGAVSWWMGWGAHEVVDKYRHSATHVKALESTGEGFRAFNLGTGNGYSVRQVVSEAERVTGAGWPG